MLCETLCRVCGKEIQNWNFAGVHQSGRKSKRAVSHFAHGLFRTSADMFRRFQTYTCDTACWCQWNQLLHLRRARSCRLCCHCLEPLSASLWMLLLRLKIQPSPNIWTSGILNITMRHRTFIEETDKLNGTWEQLETLWEFKPKPEQFMENSASCSKNNQFSTFTTTLGDTKLDAPDSSGTEKPFKRSNSYW